MRKFLVLLLFLFSPLISSAKCSIDTLTSNGIDEIFSKYHGWQIGDSLYDDICNKLNKNNAGLRIVGEATVLNGKSIAWAYVTLFDKSTEIIISDFGHIHTSVNDNASMDVAKIELFNAVNIAVAEWKNFNLALIKLNEVRLNLKKYYSTQK